MAMSNYENYLVRKPLIQGLQKDSSRASMIYLSEAQVPGVKYHLELNWITSPPKTHLHDQLAWHAYDELILCWGLDPDKPQVLGGEIEFNIGGQPVTFNSNTGIFIPKGLPHGPLTWNKFTRPHIQMSVIFGTGRTGEIYGESRTDKAAGEQPGKRAHFDYEQYVVRSPIREMMAGLKVENRQIPTMTYMSQAQALGAPYYLEFGWIYDIPQPNPHLGEHVHYFNEILLHIGGDPQNPEDLGGEIEYHVGGQPIMFDTSSVFFLPKGLKHSPIIWHKFRKPHIEMAIMIGVGSLNESWLNSEMGAKALSPLAEGS
jgi:hypothetical protein